MAPSFRDARSALYGAPLESFVGERKRLVRELKAGGDKDGAARLATAPRPSLSAWVVNQLWRREREAFEQLLASAERLRGAADANASQQYRSTLGTLRERAVALLLAQSHAASEVTLRRVHTNLTALAARGGFEADAAEGALAADLPAPGFDAIATLGGGEPGAGAPDRAHPAATGAHTTSADATRVPPAPSEDGAGPPRRPPPDAARRAREQADERAQAQAEAQAQARARAALVAAQAAAERARRLELERLRIDAQIQAKEDERERQGQSRDRVRAELERAEATLRHLDAELEGLRSQRAGLGPSGPSGDP